MAPPAAGGNPVWTTTSTPTATLTSTTGGSGEAFGLSVALSSAGTTALVGASAANDEVGAAYIFHVSSKGAWTTSATPTATLTNGTGQVGDHFGTSVALSGNGTTAIVGASEVGSYTGAAYVFHVSSAGSWKTTSTPTATLTNSAGTTDSYFGTSAALSSDGTTAFVGSPDFDTSRAGAVYVYHVASQGSWGSSSAPTAALTNSGGKGGDNLGWSVAVSTDGTTALVGGDGVSSDTGAAYIFHAAAETSWTTTATPTATLTNAAGKANDSFGSTVALSADGTTALVGAHGVGGDIGAAYVYHAAAETSWATTSAPTATLTNSAGVMFDNLGIAVALSASGTTAVVGADGVNSLTGAVYIFQTSSESAWSSSAAPTATLTDSAGVSEDELGTPVAVSSDGTTVLTGAEGTNSFTGAADVFESASKLAFTEQPPASVAAGTKFTVAASVEYPSGKVDASDSKTRVTLSIKSNPSGATLTCTANPVRASAGVATFKCSVSKAGTGYTLGAQAAPLTAAVSSKFNVT